MKFNKRLKRQTGKPDTTNFAGGQAHSQSDKLELITIMLTSFLENQFYRKGDEAANRLVELINRIPDKRFVARAALYARREAGMRSVSHLVAGEIAHAVKGEQWTKEFFERIVFRADDVLEILAYYIAVYGKPLPNSLKKGLGSALTKFDAYQLAKYRRDSAELKMVDAVNLLHPPHSEALRQLVDGTLVPAETWEAKLTEAGQTAKSDREKDSNKAQVWSKLVRERKIGYFALIRNLRNILEQAPQLTNEVAELLMDRKLIRKSMVLPFRYRVALDALEASGGERGKRQKVIRALNKAVDRSLSNVPRFPGRTLIAMDCSGSMLGKPMKIGSLFASVLYKVNDADLMLFSGEARFASFNSDDGTLSLAQRIEEKAEWSGTNFHAVFQRANQAYDRIVILSDMQAWMGHWTPKDAFDRYVAKVGKRPRVYSFDLAGYGTLQFPEKEVYALAGFSDKTMGIMKSLERDKRALVREIESIEL
ncbi:MAG: TROVE domain-containing protein [Verrucomicrobiales bacterium]|nr:TROVE domain-containing protein [Verrucomicrobiales bacterium]